MNRKEQILKLKNEGLTIKEISIKLNLPYSSVCYHFADRYKNRALNYQKEYQKNNKQKRGDEYRKYQREYHKIWYAKNKSKQIQGIKN